MPVRTQAALAAVESDLAAKRSQLDTVASLLTAKRKELSFEEQRTAIREEGARARLPAPRPLLRGAAQRVWGGQTMA